VRHLRFVHGIRAILVLENYNNKNTHDKRKFRGNGGRERTIPSSDAVLPGKLRLRTVLFLRDLLSAGLTKEKIALAVGTRPREQLLTLKRLTGQ